MSDEPIVVERTVPVPPEAVWPYISVGALWARWQGRACSIDAFPGGEFTMTMPDGAIASGHVVEAIENERIVITWGWVGTPLAPGSTTVEIALRPVPPGGTRITLTHYGLPAELIDHHLGGWNRCLTRLTEIVETD